MNGVEYVREVCKEKGITVKQLETDLGFSNGYFNPKKLKTIPYDRAVKTAEYLNCDINKIIGEQVQTNYYLNDETAQIAQQIFENKELRALFDVGRKSDPKHLKMCLNLLKELRKE